MKLEIGKCYVRLNYFDLTDVFKVYSSDVKKFKTLIKCEGISLRPHNFGLYEVFYMGDEQDDKFIEITEEEFQKFLHLHKIYVESLDLKKKEVYGNIRNEGGLG